MSNIPNKKQLRNHQASAPDGSANVSASHRQWASVLATLLTLLIGQAWLVYARGANPRDGLFMAVVSVLAITITYILYRAYNRWRASPPTWIILICCVFFFFVVNAVAMPFFQKDQPVEKIRETVVEFFTQKEHHATLTPVSSCIQDLRVRVIIDIDHNNIAEENEPGKPGVPISLTPLATGSSVEQQANVTDAQGVVVFKNLPSGRYLVEAHLTHQVKDFVLIESSSVVELTCEHSSQTVLPGHDVLPSPTLSPEEILLPLSDTPESLAVETPTSPATSLLSISPTPSVAIPPVPSPTIVPTIASEATNTVSASRTLPPTAAPTATMSPSASPTAPSSVTLPPIVSPTHTPTAPPRNTPIPDIPTATSTPTATPSATPTPRPTASSTPARVPRGNPGEIRLFGDPQQRHLLYSIESGRVYRQNQIILFFNGERVFRGPNTSGEILFTVVTNRIFAGASAAGRPTYLIQDSRVFRGSTGPIIYTIYDDRVFQGPNHTGEIVFQANVDLVGDVVFLLPILADEAFRPQAEQ